MSGDSILDKAVNLGKAAVEAYENVSKDAKNSINREVNKFAYNIRDHHKSEVVIINETGATIKNIHLKHKYSNNFRSSKTWDFLENGATSSPSMVVEHATGMVTTGRDWWFVCWSDNDGNLFHNSPALGLGLLAVAEDAVKMYVDFTIPAAGRALSAVGLIGENVESYNVHTLSERAVERPTRIFLCSDHIRYDSRQTKDETFQIVKIPHHIWKGWNPRFEQEWDLPEPLMKRMLYFNLY